MKFTEIKDALAVPFDVAELKFKPQAVSKKTGKAKVATYADSRTYQKALDEICPNEWECDIELTTTANLVLATAKVTICGLTRTSTGEEKLSDQNPATSAEAQAFKRACSFFGLGRFMYGMDLGWHKPGDYGFSKETTAMLRKNAAKQLKQKVPTNVRDDGPPDEPAAPAAPAKPTTPEHLLLTAEQKKKMVELKTKANINDNSELNFFVKEFMPDWEEYLKKTGRDPLSTPAFKAITKDTCDLFVQFMDTYEKDSGDDF